MAEPLNPFRTSIWDSADADNLRTFLKSPSGVRFIRRLRGDRPPVSGPTIERAALSGAEATGYEGAVNNIFDYCVVDVDMAIPSLYPSLDNDADWNDISEQQVPNEAALSTEGPSTENPTPQ